MRVGNGVVRDWEKVRDGIMPKFQKSMSLPQKKSVNTPKTISRPLKNNIRPAQKTMSRLLKNSENDVRTPGNDVEPVEKDVKPTEKDIKTTKTVRSYHPK